MTTGPSLLSMPSRFAFGLALAACTHHAGVLKKYESTRRLDDTAQMSADAKTEWRISADVSRTAADGVVRGNATGQVAGTIEYEVTAHVIEAVHEYGLFAATVRRAIVAPLYFALLGPITGALVPDYGDDGTVGVGDRLLCSIHVLNPLMAWPLDPAVAGAETVVATRRERRPTRIAVAPDLQLALVSRRGTVSLPVPVADDGRFEVALLPGLEPVWDDDLRGELRERKSGQVVVVHGLAARAGEHLAALGRREPLEWAIACATDTREGFAKFTRTHPDSPRAAAIAARLHELDWRDAARSDDREAYAAFLRQHPDSHHAPEARTRLEAADWREAERVDTTEAYEQFLAAFPDGAQAGPARRRIDALMTARDWRRAEQADTVAAHREFIGKHPSGEATAASRARLALLERHESEWLAACAIGTAQAFRDYAATHPQSPYVDAAARAVRDGAGRDIVDLIEEGRIEVVCSGAGIDSVSLEIRRLVDYPVTVRIPTGSYFVASRAEAQNMIATGETTTALTTDATEPISVAAACANQPKDVPGLDDSFAIRRPDHASRLVPLMSALQRANADAATRQAAVWLVTDDATYDGLGTLVSRLSGEVSGGTRVIGPIEAARALKCCADAGIDIRGMRLLADRPAFVDALPDGELKSWLKEQVPAPRQQ